MRNVLAPVSYQCGYQIHWGDYFNDPANGPVRYQKLFFSREDEVWGLTNGLDINSGIFTSQFRGVYEVSWSVVGWDSNFSPTDHTVSAIYLYKNNVEIKVRGTLALLKDATPDLVSQSPKLVAHAS